jgi:undecaprenyl-diphosphatase
VGEIEQMSTLEAFCLGVVQGLTEFFPVSSSGHLVIFRSLFGIQDGGGLLFEIVVHVATLLAIAIYYRKRIMDLVGGVLSRRRDALHYAGMLVIGTCPAVLVGLSARGFIERQFQNPVATGIALLVTGAILWTTRSAVPSRGEATQDRPSTGLSWRLALLVGCGQALAILPGISRSGTTVAVALALGLAPAAAAEFSFLLGIIAIAGAAVLMLPELAVASPEVLGNLVYGSVAALAAGLAAIWAFIRMLESGRFYFFAAYVWAVGGLFLLWTLAGS